MKETITGASKRLRAADASHQLCRHVDDLRGQLCGGVVGHAEGVEKQSRNRAFSFN